ncbi:MAG: hypothetical protein R6U96_04880 [Promethearchaeia archaeon]
MTEKNKENNKDPKKSKESIQKQRQEKPIKSENKEETVESKLNMKPVLLKAEAYKTIILYVSRYANKSIPQEEWKEVYGLLIGNADDDAVYVNRAEALTFGHATDVQLDQRHYVFIDEIQRKLDQEDTNNYIVGWFHSHPGLGLFFSYIDIINQLGFQSRNKDFCGLVYDHTLLGKKKKEEIGGNVLTKYDTGFEIYRLNDTEMDPDNPDFENNYHKIDYIIDGLNKFFFANVLNELSALATAQKPLQSAYGEETEEDQEVKNNVQNTPHSPPPQGYQKEQPATEENLVDIPTEEEVSFNMSNTLMTADKETSSSKEKKSREEAEQLIYQGNQAFKEKDTVSGVTKYRRALKILQNLGDYNRMLESLSSIAEQLISTNHFVLANEFIEKLHTISSDQENFFYRGDAHYLQGYLKLKQSETKEEKKKVLEDFQKGAVNYLKVNDYAGAGRCFHKMGRVCHLNLNLIDNACLFYTEAIRYYNEGITRNHPLRKSFWNTSEALIQTITEIKDIVEDLLPSISESNVLKKVKEGLTSIRYNF